MIIRNLKSFREKVVNIRATLSKGDRDQLFVF